MLEEFGRLVLSVHRGSRELPMESFQDWALNSLRPYVYFDSAAWVTSTIHGLHDSATFHTRHFYKQPPELLTDWLKCKGATTFPRKLFAAPGTAFCCTPATDMEPEVAAHCRRYGIEQILTIAQVDAVAGVHEMISLYRSNSAHPYNEDERRFQQCLAPHLVEAWRVCRMRHLYLSQIDIARNAYTAGTDAHGILHLVDPGFTLLLQEEWPDWKGPKLPATLLESCRNGDRNYSGQRIAFNIILIKDHYMLRCRRKLPIDSLSRREREVAQYYAAGRDYKQIAQALGLSPSTVRNHLGTIYGKLGIDNKAALAALMNE